jgi:oligogalacturonide lyase
MVFGQSRKPQSSAKSTLVDPGTEAEIRRLTEPGLSACSLPRAHQILFTRGRQHLLYVSDRGGSWQAWALDPGSGKSRRLTSARALDIDSVTLSEDGKSIAYLDGNALFSGSTGGGAKKLHEFATKPGPGLAFAGPSILVPEGRKLISVPRRSGGATVAAESDHEIEDPIAQPGGQLAGFRSGGGLWVTPFAGGAAKRLPVPAGGRVIQARWAGSGGALLYLHAAETPGVAVTIQEVSPSEGASVLVANTSQYVCFTSNHDSSVLFGASSSKAGPVICLILRRTGREMVLCEHAAREPARLRIAVSPDSQRLVFHSDREGKSAIYLIDLQKLVEKSES